MLCFELGDIVSDGMISEDSIETADVTIAFDDNNNFSAHMLGWWLDELELRPKVLCTLYNVAQVTWGIT